MPSDPSLPVFNFPKGIVIVGKELALAWEDGTENYLPLPALRKACPCAACAGEPDVMGQTYQPLKKELTLEAFELRSYQFIGGYALQFFWGDGHSSGIYSFHYLRGLQ